MSQDPVQQTLPENSHPTPQPGPPVLPFDIDEFLPEHQRKRSWFGLGRPNPVEYFSDGPATSSSVRTARGRHSITARHVLVITTLLLLVFGVVRFGAWSSLAAYPGTGQCYRIERWLYGVDSDLTRIQWALADAEVEVTNDVVAEDANDRIWQMFADMRTSLAENPVPKELTELRALWLQFLDLGFEIRKANQRGDIESLDRLGQEQDEVLAQRLEEEARVARNCRLADVGHVTERVRNVGNHWNLQIATRGAFYGGVR